RGAFGKSLFAPGSFYSRCRRGNQRCTTLDCFRGLNGAAIRTCQSGAINVCRRLFITKRYSDKQIP
ncbi:hypothetical protein HKBW3S03_01230, partial [Candidatus Hakubella thermalkaliphila]